MCSCFTIQNGEPLVDKEMLGKAHELLQPFMLRRLKETVEKLLPPRIETVIDCPLSEMQVSYHDEAQKDRHDSAPDGFRVLFGCSCSGTRACCRRTPTC